MPDKDTVTFDARPFQHRHEEPFPHIMAVVEHLRPGQDLLLINTFDPRPIEAVLSARGFRYEVREVEPEHWEVRFIQDDERDPGEPSLLDNRGVTPAQASVRTLQTLRRMESEQPLVVLFDQDPEGFCAELRRRGYEAIIERHPDRDYRVVLKKL